MSRPSPIRQNNRNELTSTKEENKTGSTQFQPKKNEIDSLYNSFIGSQSY